MKLLLILGLALSNFVSASVSGQGSSGGGNAVVCYEGSAIKSAELFDLFEGQNVFGDVLDYRRETKNYAQTMSQALSRLEKSAYGAVTGFNDSMGLRDMVKHVETKMRLLSKSAQLQPINDSFEVSVPRNCRIVQAAAFIDKGTILFDQNIWEKLSEFDRAGLVLHEAVYWFDRNSSWKHDSRRSRRIVSQALSEHFPYEPVTTKRPYYLCESQKWGAETKLGITGFLIYLLNGRQVVEFMFLDGDPILSRKILHLAQNLPFDERAKENEAHIGVSGLTDSLYEENDAITLYSHPKYDSTGAVSGSVIQMTSSKKESYPARKIEPQLFRCSFHK